MAVSQDVYVRWRSGMAIVCNVVESESTEETPEGATLEIVSIKNSI
jgi:hypothetical protein